MTGEGKGETEKWIEAKEAKYAYGYEKTGSLARYFGVKGIPHVVIIDANGVVVYNGGAGGYSDDLLRKATAGALATPIWEWSAAAKSAKAALLKKQYKAALDEAAKLPEADGGPAITEAIKGMVKGKVALLKAAFEKGDFLGALNDAKELRKDLAGLPEEAEAAKVEADIDAHPSAADVIKLQKQIAKIRDKAPTKRKEVEKAVEDLKKIEKAGEGGYAATEAAQLAEQLRQSLLKDR